MVQAGYQPAVRSMLLLSESSLEAARKVGVAIKGGARSAAWKLSGRGASHQGLRE